MGRAVWQLGLQQWKLLSHVSIQATQCRQCILTVVSRHLSISGIAAVLRNARDGLGEHCELKNLMLLHGNHTDLG